MSEAGAAPAPPALPSAPPPRPRRRKGAVREYGESALIALGVALFLRAFVVEPYRVPTGSMAPTLQAGDAVLASKLAYGVRLPLSGAWVVRWREPRRGDVVVFEHPREPGRLVVKRIVGVEGDVVALKGQVLHVNGVAQPRERAGEGPYEERSAAGTWWSETCPRFHEQPAPEPDGAPARDGWDVLQCGGPGQPPDAGPFEPVRPGHFFVLGDNRDRSQDSRGEGGWQVPVSKVHGRVERIGWSWGPRPSGAGAVAGFRSERLFKRIE